MQDIREILIAEIEPDIGIAIVDYTPLRSAKNDSEAKKGKKFSFAYEWNQ